MTEYKLIQADAREGLKQLEANSVHCCVTSPPYFGQRDYKVSGQIGLENSLQDYIDNLVSVFEQVKRVLREDGTFWLNVGDSYYNYRPSGAKKQSWHKSERDLADSRDVKLSGLKQKDLIGVPWMLAFALRDCGWWLRQELIWYKTNPMPGSMADRSTLAHEQIFLLTKNKNYFYDKYAIGEEIDYGIGKGIKNKLSVWKMTPARFRGAHFATFPVELPETCLLAGSPTGYCSECGEPMKRTIVKVSLLLSLRVSQRRVLGSKENGATARASPATHGSLFFPSGSTGGPTSATISAAGTTGTTQGHGNALDRSGARESPAMAARSTPLYTTRNFSFFPETSAGNNGGSSGAKDAAHGVEGLPPTASIYEVLASPERGLASQLHAQTLIPPERKSLGGRFPMAPVNSVNVASAAAMASHPQTPSHIPTPSHMQTPSQQAFGAKFSSGNAEAVARSAVVVGLGGPAVAATVSSFLADVERSVAPVQRYYAPPRGNYLLVAFAEPWCVERLASLKHLAATATAAAPNGRSSSRSASISGFFSGAGSGGGAITSPGTPAIAGAGSGANATGNVNVLAVLPVASLEPRHMARIPALSDFLDAVASDSLSNLHAITGGRPNNNPDGSVNASALVSPVQMDISPRHSTLAETPLGPGYAALHSFPPMTSMMPVNSSSGSTSMMPASSSSLMPATSLLQTPLHSSSNVQGAGLQTPGLRTPSIQQPQSPALYPHIPSSLGHTPIHQPQHIQHIQQQQPYVNALGQVLGSPVMATPKGRAGTAVGTPGQKARPKPVNILLSPGSTAGTRSSQGHRDAGDGPANGVLSKAMDYLFGW